ncbi:hypothetical protein CBS101457_004095 [Exobasidium rhododendri]|nr:hypothetical protein CBS101457_004095 [Exobasidium rhododendri]
MRTSMIFMSLLASIAAVSAVPVSHQARDVSLPNVELEQRDMEHFESNEKRAMISPRITYYSGKQLNNPACGGSNPSPESHIAAVRRGGAFSCGERIKIQHNGHEVVVKVVDYMAASSSPYSIDLSPGAFSALAPLSAGVISNAQVVRM